MKMNPKNRLIYLFLAAALAFSCAKDDPALAPFSQPLVVEIVAGPADGETVLNNARFSFEWRARGGGSAATYQVQLSGVDAGPVSTAETARTYEGQTEGNYTFTVTASAGGEAANVSRTFNVGPNMGPPSVVIFGARGTSSDVGTGVTPAYAAGQSAFFRWIGEDVDTFGSVTGYRWRITDSDAFNNFSLANVAGFVVPPTSGTYTFTLEAQDNNGAVSTTTIDYEVKAPSILIVDDKPQGSAVDEIDEDNFHAALFEGFAFATWDISQQGAPATADLTPFEVVVIYSGASTDFWRDIGTNYPESSVPLSEYLDGGGRLWAMGQGIMEDIDRGHDNPPAPDEFEAVHLHLAPATGDSATDAGRQWGRAGEFSGNLKFSFADNLLGDDLNYPRITMDLQAGDAENIFPGDNAQLIYEGKGGLGDVVGNVALRWPAGGTDTRVVFFTFPLFETAAVKASLLNSRALAQQLMREMGQ